MKFKMQNIKFADDVYEQLKPLITYIFSRFLDTKNSRCQKYLQLRFESFRNELEKLEGECNNDTSFEYLEEKIREMIVQFQYPSSDMKIEGDSKEMLWNWRKERSLSSPKVLHEMIAFELKVYSNEFSFE